MAILVRPMAQADLPQVLALQHISYPPALWDGYAAFESRLALAPTTNLVLFSGEDLLGYLVSHPWASAAPPPVDAVLDRLPADLGCWFIHDLATAPGVRRRGVGRRLFSAGMEAARALGLRRAELIAISGAAPVWRRLGLEPVSLSEDLAAKVAGYGLEATYMARDL